MENMQSFRNLQVLDEKLKNMYSQNKVRNVFLWPFKIYKLSELTCHFTVAVALLFVGKMVCIIHFCSQNFKWFYQLHKQLSRMAFLRLELLFRKELVNFTIIKLALIFAVFLKKSLTFVVYNLTFTVSIYFSF